MQEEWRSQSQVGGVPPRDKAKLRASHITDMRTNLEAWLREIAPVASGCQDAESRNLLSVSYLMSVQ